MVVYTIGVVAMALGAAAFWRSMVAVQALGIILPAAVPNLSLPACCLPIALGPARCQIEHDSCCCLAPPPARFLNLSS